MKKILTTASSFLIGLVLFAQVDSSTLNVTFPLSFEEWSFAVGANLLDVTSLQGEALYDKLKVISRSGNPNANTPISSDTVDARVPYLMSVIMRSMPYAQVSPFYNSMHSGFKKATGPGAAWLKRQLDSLDKRDELEVARPVQRGSGRLKKTNNP